MGGIDGRGRPWAASPADGTAQRSGRTLDRRPGVSSGRYTARASAVASQILIIAVVLAAWEFLPKIGDLAERSNFLDPFFISSPSRVFARLLSLATGSEGSAVIWPYVWPTVEAAILGSLVGMVLGASVGLVLSSFAFLATVLRPLLVALNAVPRIALIPIVVILFGSSLVASVVIAVMVVFFIVFFNAHEGGLSVPPQLIENVTVFGANRWQVMRHIRLPYVLAWTTAVLPSAVTFALLSVVTAEVLTGYPGLGRMISIATVSADSSLTFAVVVVLAVVGVVTVQLATLVRQRTLHWWAKE